MKAVIFSICRDASIVDITHAIPAGDILAASVTLEDSLQAFPPGCVHLVVVDPGVGSQRRTIAVRSGRSLFVGPDNGVFTAILASPHAPIVRSLDSPLLRRGYPHRKLSATFHGRDLFAPAAAHLAGGFPFARVGPVIHDPVLLPIAHPELREGNIHGQILGFDHFGNASTNIRLDWIPVAARVRCNGTDFGLIRCYYAEVHTGDPVPLINSAGRLELAVRDGSAHALGLCPGDIVEVTGPADSLHPDD